MTSMYNNKRTIQLAAVVALGVAFLFVLGVWLQSVDASTSLSTQQKQTPTGLYKVLAWNDLGMHCYNRDFKDLAVLPPYNTIWAQVIQVSDPPEIITTGITVEFLFIDNTFSVGKSNFWDYDQQLFGVNLPPNVGLTGVGLAGQMVLNGDHFEAIGIPLTEFSDSQPSIPDPYQVATIIVKQAGTGLELTRAKVVVPVSTEMHCDYCHYDFGPGNDDIGTGVVEQNILTKHDEENSGNYPPGHTGLLMNRRPILCAECHATNALGKPGVAGLPNLSNAMHEKHDGKVQDSLSGCYSCHPGPQTQCLRDVMSQSISKIYCVDCHGTMYQVSKNPNPWLHEPRCDNAICHGSGYAQDQPLYRMSKDHGGVYCEGCHDSPHAIAPSREAKDAIKFYDLQDHNGPVDVCTTCHSVWPILAGPHGKVVAPPTIYLPVVIR